MDKLPVEILTKIIDYLSPKEQVRLQLVSRRFFALSRDNTRWKLHCYENSWSASENASPNGRASETLPVSSVASLSSLGPGTLRNLIQPQVQSANRTATNGQDAARGSSLQRSRAAADWDPSYPTEDVDWYSEYIARHGPISFSWLQHPSAATGHSTRRDISDVKGLGLLRDWSSAREDKVVAPLEDGSVCIWDLNHSHTSTSSATKGKLAGVSSPGILFADLSGRSEKSSVRSPAPEFLNVGECVSVDSIRKRAYIAVANILNEVDLETLQVISQERYAWSIFALSQETDYSVPLTLATTLSLQIYDSRLSMREEEEQISLRCEKEPVHFIPNSDLYSHPDCQVLQLQPNGQPPHRIRSPDPLEKGANYAPLFQPGPLSILHPPTPHVNTILLAGRFPSILCYDRRCFPRLQNAVHSGGRLCGLASVPAPSFPISSVTHWPDTHTIVACGEYNGRGSLELYKLSFSGSDPQEDSASSSFNQSAVYQNRQSAASSKLLSVASHGVRIVYSDAGGNIKWVERDGRTQVRRWNINTDRRRLKRASLGGSSDASSSPSGMFWSSDPGGSSDVARKILPTDANLLGDELLIWTGDRIGRLRFSHDDGEPDSDEEQADEEELRRKEYARMIRRALERQADEVRWMGRLGMA
ncbi:hypothetical protein VTN77DRAFT_7600 [Rasamsonia byssochlamydoides]|uniref:uncharacterized protein n=1 Tax=Rasamsonia byssochlamydoides TaxID=89139 RepID=UPI0037436B86